MSSNKSINISDSMEQNQRFMTFLEHGLQRLKRVDDAEELQEQKKHIIDELESMLNNHKQWSVYFFQVAHYLNSIHKDSDRLARELNRVTRLSLTDELTGLPNRRAFLQKLDEEIKRVERYQHPLSLAILDLDAFKPINDNYGHPIGDRVLRAYAKSVLTLFRQHDLVARYGGEEFAVIFPETDIDGALTALKKVQEEAEKLSYALIDSTIKLPSFSAGLTLYTLGESSAQFIQRADSALYNAKEKGKGRIEINQPH